MAFKINTKYKEKMNYERSVEERQRMKAKYGKEVKIIVTSSEDSSGSTDDENAKFDTGRKHLEFLKVFSKIKGKDEEIYGGKNYYQEELLVSSANKSQKKPKPLTLKNYDQEFIKAGADFDETELENLKKSSAKPTYVEEQKKLVKAFKENDSISSSSDDENEILKKKVKSKEEVEDENLKYVDWIRGTGKDADFCLKDSDKTDLEGLRSAFQEKKLDEKEQFLWDYILDQKWKKKGSDSEDDESSDSSESGMLSKKQNKSPKPGESNLIDHQDQPRSLYLNSSEEERNDNFLKKQELEEFTYNHRHEEPNADKLVSFPRKVDNSLKQNLEATEKSKKRKAEKDKKLALKKQKLDDFKLQKKLKKSEIAEKLAAITGAASSSNSNANNSNSANASTNDFSEFNMDETAIKSLGIDLDKDWDPDEHAKLMEKMFNSEFYENDNFDTVKPEWDDLNEEIAEETRAERRRREREERKERKTLTKSKTNKENVAPDGEEAPQLTTNLDLSKASEITSLKSDLEQLNKIELQAAGEGDFFKYRQTTPNDFGLTEEQILSAEDKELNQWAPLGKIVKIRSKEEDEKDRDYFRNQMKVNRHRRARIFKSLFDSETGELKEDTEKPQTETTTKQVDSDAETPDQKLKITEPAQIKTSISESPDLDIDRSQENQASNKNDSEKIKKVRGKKHKVTKARLEAYGLEVRTPKGNKEKKKLKKKM